MSSMCVPVGAGDAAAGLCNGLKRAMDNVNFSASSSSSKMLKMSSRDSKMPLSSASTQSSSPMSPRSPDSASSAEAPSPATSMMSGPFVPLDPRLRIADLGHATSHIYTARQNQDRPITRVTRDGAAKTLSGHGRIRSGSFARPSSCNLFAVSIATAAGLSMKPSATSEAGPELPFQCTSGKPTGLEPSACVTPTVKDVIPTSVSPSLSLCPPPAPSARGSGTPPAVSSSAASNPWSPCFSSGGGLSTGKRSTSELQTLLPTALSVDTCGRPGGCGDKLQVQQPTSANTQPVRTGTSTTTSNPTPAAAAAAALGGGAFGASPLIDRLKGSRPARSSAVGVSLKNFLQVYGADMQWVNAIMGKAAVAAPQEADAAVPRSSSERLGSEMCAGEGAGAARQWLESSSSGLRPLDRRFEAREKYDREAGVRNCIWLEGGELDARSDGVAVTGEAAQNVMWAGRSAMDSSGRRESGTTCCSTTSSVTQRSGPGGGGSDCGSGGAGLRARCSFPRAWPTQESGSRAAYHSSVDLQMPGGIITATSRPASGSKMNQHGRTTVPTTAELSRGTPAMVPTEREGTMTWLAGTPAARTMVAPAPSPLTGTTPSTTTSSPNTQVNMQRAAVEATKWGAESVSCYLSYCGRGSTGGQATAQAPRVSYSSLGGSSVGGCFGSAAGSDGAPQLPVAMARDDPLLDLLCAMDEDAFQIDGDQVEAVAADGLDALGGGWVPRNAGGGSAGGGVNAGGASVAGGDAVAAVIGGPDGLGPVQVLDEECGGDMGEADLWAALLDSDDEMAE